MKAKIKALEQALANYNLNEGNTKAFKKAFITRSSALEDLFQELPNLSMEDRKEAGRALNALKKAAQEKYAQYLAAQDAAASQQEKKIDLSLPPMPIPIGGLHPLTWIEAKVVQILSKVGFELIKDREIEDEWHNFTALNIPPDHPARDMQDTFFIEPKKGTEKDRMVLRTHTSPVQVRIMEAKKPPIRVVSVGRVFRNETISARSHCVFHQLEALYVDKAVSFVDLKEVLYYFIQEIFSKEVSIRLRPSYFPFTEPSAEVDIGCLVCRQVGCQLCKQSGWLELGELAW